MSSKKPLFVMLFFVVCLFGRDHEVAFQLREGAFHIVNREIPPFGQKIDPVEIRMTGNGRIKLIAVDAWGNFVPWGKTVELKDSAEVLFDAGLGYYKISAMSGKKVVGEINFGIVPPFHPGVRERSFFCSNTSHIRLGKELELLQRIGMKVQRVHIASDGAGRTKKSTILDTLRLHDNWILPIVGYSLGEKSEWAKQYNQHGPPADFCHFVSEWEKIVRDFHEVKIWEFWNEPWIFGWTWADTPFRYRELQTLWSNMALKIIPDAEIIVGNSWMFTMDHIKPYPDCWRNGLVHGTSHHPYVDNPALNWRSGAYQRSHDATSLLNRSMGLEYTYITEGGSSVASSQFDHLHHSDFEGPNNILNAAKIPQLFTYNALAGVYQSNMQWDIGYGEEWTMSNTSFGVYTHLTEDRPVLVDIWPENELITGAIFANPKFVDAEIRSLRRADEIDARWEVTIPEYRKDDDTKVAILWSLTGRHNFDLDDEGQIIIGKAEGLRAFDMMGVEIQAQESRFVLPFGQYPVYVVTEGLSVMELYERIRGAKIEKVTPLNLYVTSLIQSPSESQKIRIRCKNQLAKPVSVDFKISIPGHRVSHRAMIPAAALTDVFVSWPGTKIRKDNRYPIQIRTSTSVNGKVFAKQTFKQDIQHAAFACRSIQVDGNPSDWDGVVPVHLTAVSEADESKYLLNPNLKKPKHIEDETATASLYAAYDADYVYLCLRGWGVQTSVGRLSKPGLDLWKKGEPDGLDHISFCGDVLQVTFGFRERVPHMGRQPGDPWEWKGHYYDTDYQYAVYKDACGEDHVMRQWGPDTDRRTAYQIDLVPYVEEPEGVQVKITEKCYEVAIPRSELDLLDPEMGEFRFDFMLNGKFQWAASAGVFDFWKSNGSYSPSWTVTRPCQDFWGIDSPVKKTTTDCDVRRPRWPLKVVTAEIVPGVQKAWIEDQAGNPFLWNGDTCWFLTFGITEADVLHYLDNRAAKGIFMVQCMLIPWAREGEDAWFGDKPFCTQQLDRPNEKYWKHVDFVVEAAKERGITLCMALVWSGCCGEGWTKILQNDYHTENDFETLRQYARFIGKRYGDAGNVIVFLGGDSSENHAQFKAMAIELKKTAPELLIAHHPSSWYGHEDTYGIKSATSLGEHGHGDYLDISWTYTYWPNQNKREHSHPYYLNHLEWNRNQRIPVEVSRVRPFLLGEAGYENERGSELRRIRRLMHWNIVCGAIGHGFGNGSIWKLAEDWKIQLDSPGSIALGHMAAIYAPYAWWKLVPEQPRDEFFIGEPLRITGGETFILSGQEAYDNVLSLEEERGQKFVAAAKTPDGSLMMAYFPHFYGKSGLEIDMSVFAGPMSAEWVDPQSAERRDIPDSPLHNRVTRIFSPPGKNSFGDRDWILILYQRPEKEE